MRQKGISQNGCFKKTKQVNFPKNEYFLPPVTCAYHGVRNIRPFALLPTNCDIFLDIR